MEKGATNLDSPLEYISEGNTLYAIIVRASFQGNGTQFLTSDTDPLQLGVFSHPKGKILASHLHRKNERKILETHEVLVIRKGKLRVDLYRIDGSSLCSRILSPHDVILFHAGGHGFEILEDLEMIEVKQGPYSGTDDKILLNRSHT